MAETASILHCTRLTFQKINDPRGSLTFIEGGRHIPFDIKRVFYMYDIPAGESRGAHAHKAQHQILICLSGSFDVAIDDGCSKDILHLDNPWSALHVPPMIWASEANFSSGAVCLVLTSDLFDADEYIRDYDEFIRLKAAQW